MINRDIYAGNPLHALFPRPSHRNNYDDWSDTAIRRERYNVLWSFYDETIYRSLFGAAIRQELALYKNTDTIYSPIKRIVDFHVTYLLGGSLARDAGVGNPEPSALPIIPGKKAKAKELAEIIADTWVASRFAQRKSILTRYGAAMGDFGMELIDDPKSGRIRMRVMNPHEIKAAEFDPYGHLKFISLERIIPETTSSGRQSERTGGNQVFQERLYREDVELQDDGTVTYTTYRDETVYAWPGTKGEKSGGKWDSPFPFIPVTLGQHIDVDFPFGASEAASAIMKAVRADAQGSNLGDGVVRMVNGPWFLKGARMKTTGILRPGGEWLGAPNQGQNSPSPSQPSVRLIHSNDLGSKNDFPILECDSTEADMSPLMYPIPVADVNAFIKSLTDICRDDFPEIQADIATSAGSASGRALRVARQTATAKIEERRLAYDELIVTAHKKALIMGGILKYEGYGSFGECELESPEIEHYIGPRPVFPADPLDTIEIRQAENNMLKTGVEAGIPIEVGMERAGWSEKDIAKVVAAKKAEKAEADAAEQKQLGGMMNTSPTSDGQPPDPNAAPDPETPPETA